jgi:pilus assembly protein Flp/PilA
VKSSAFPTPTAKSILGEEKMKNLMHLIVARLQGLKNQEEGQDLVEYALVVALIAFGATAGMGALASGINNAFNTISSTLATSVTSIVF